ncbi:chromosome segregation protein [Breznakia sp. PF5-3]|uniref:chromosome segregation protein SMC n=1 Tax=unclassified Breznakia TaxID=2623764 RepID=UPI0024058239|nr:MULTISPECIES: chromosome segregation protein SMC [unclassified Breznakia]MDF9824409.1 chromosome segregation protein [Breznakia sp. PM6-1]MDF9835138.1 chromosome segregation protein [Breznakia sp. PF5-3]MDF9838214.1 chromosome segregation protein [Breznakia sp. PFB2-8]MDF9860229.1 chromosome segregation protein [Breznakia sp. PH5-24]
MFLKRVELQGFKSFADKTVIEFENDVTGIVGPNGCGKSNVNDAIRWVLGEQSAKSLRGSNMSDVIFSGSQGRKAINMAEVTLVFDNTKKHFDVEFEEVAITRRLFRNSGEAEYLINNTPCRLKDVVNMVMDSGLGRDSLSVISQGNIQSFVESRPEDRRALFEEAAGVAKYKKRKNESLNKLNRTQENLLRVEDIVEELEARVNPLKRQAKKAETYLEKKKTLETIEISVIVDEVQSYNSKIEELKNKSFENESQRAIAETTIQVEDQKNQEDRQEMSVLDSEVHKLQNEFMNVVNEISTLDARKTEIDEKRKYTMEYASDAERIVELKKMLDEAKYEYEDREKRLKDLDIDYDLSVKNYERLDQEFTSLAEQNSNITSYVNKLSNRKEVLSNLIKSPFNHQQGVKTIMDAKESLYGICGVVSQLLLPKEGYEEAISSALGGALYHIVSEDEDCARNAISFLKKNKSGRATFLPKTVLKERMLSPNDTIVAENTTGYLGVANEFVEYEDDYAIVANALLGNVLVCEKLIHANELARLLKYNYKIITLDGEVVHKGGSMTGGKVRDSYSPLTIAKELKQVEEKLEKQLLISDDLNAKLNQTRIQLQGVDEEKNQHQLAIAKLQPLVDVKKSKYEKLNDEYKEMNPELLEETNVQKDELVIKLSDAHSSKDKIESDLQVKRDRRFKLGRDVEKREARIRDIRRDLNVLNNLEREQEVERVKCETNLENVLQRLSSIYEMTFEHAKTLKQDQSDVEAAREEVLRLRSEIAKLGNVNLDAPEEYKEVSERFELLVSQRDELLEAKNKILEAIDEMDEVMIKQFSEMFYKINEELKETFRALFGGGKADLYLTDPEDVLNSGIEITVQPPGKSIENMRSLSGGEKALLAMSVLFAILRARTIPLCIFDEVEAALDQANVEKFAKYVSNFRGESQFIIVTHRPGTMSQCDALYGVTMQKDGVSKFLKVKLKDAMDYVQPEGEVS